MPEIAKRDVHVLSWKGMKYLDLTLPTPEENLACDEALLDWCEAGPAESGILRFWEPNQSFVVVGYANQVALEVNLKACHERHIAVLRRCSGGGTVLQGPGCLNYSLLLKIDPPLQGITETNAFIMDRHAQALAPLLAASVRGFTDLALGNKKFSGNAQRRKRNFLLFHGTFLINFDPALMQEVLLFPSKQPDYRLNRPHTEFLTSIKATSPQIKACLRNAWQAWETLPEWPEEATVHLVDTKYSKEEWNVR